MTDVTWLVWSAILAWAMVLAAGLMKYKAWTPAGLKVMMESREAVPPPGRLAGRADRAALNMLENFVLFVALVAAVHFGGKEGAQATLGAAIFFWARLFYWPVYLAGIAYVRTALWFIGVVGMAVMVFALL